MRTCPNCEAEIDRVYYRCSTSGSERGHVDLDGTISSYGYINHEFDDSETDDCYDYEYECGDCNEPISEGWIREGASPRVRLSKTNTTKPSAAPIAGAATSKMRSINGEAFSNVTKCPKCSGCVQYDAGSPTAFCQDCNREFKIKVKKVVTSFKC